MHSLVRVARRPRLAVVVVVQPFCQVLARSSSGSSGVLGNKAKQVYGKIQQFLGSLKAVALTSYRLVPVRSKAVKTRSEIEQIRENNKSLLPLTILVLSQFVPFLGNIPILLVLAYPRHFLTSSFWSPEQLAEIRALEFEEKLAARKVLQVLIGQTPAAAASAVAGDCRGLDSLSGVHLSELSKANSLYANTIIYRTLETPLQPVSAALIRKKLGKRAREIASDDALLRLMPPGELKELQAAELLTACTRRGSSPALDKDESIAFLQQWLAKESSKPGAPPHLLCHALALPGLFP